MWIYPKDFLYFGHYSHLGANSKVVQILWTSCYRYVVLVYTEHIPGYRHLCVNGCLMDHRTDSYSQYTYLTVNYMNRTVVRSDCFHYFSVL